MGPLNAAAALVVVGAATMFRTRADLFDLVQVKAPGPGPWAVLVRSKGGWDSLPLDAFPSPGGEGEILYLRANSLSQPVPPTTPPASLLKNCAGRLVAKTADRSEIRAGFLCPATAAGDGAGSGDLHLDQESFSGPRFTVQYPEGSGFYRNLQIAGAPSTMVKTLSVRLRLRALGLIPLERTEEDFLWSGFELVTGVHAARRRSEASALALVQHLDPRPQEALLTRDGMDQTVEITFPPALLRFAGGIVFENGFEIDKSSWALLPGAGEAVPLALIPPETPYEWIVLFTPGGTFLHWLEPLGEAARLNPRIYVRQGANRSSVVGYRLEDIKDTWKSAAGPDGSVKLVQHLAVLGGPDWIERRSDLKWVGALAHALAGPAPGWTLSLEPL